MLLRTNSEMRIFAEDTEIYKRKLISKGMGCRCIPYSLGLPAIFRFLHYTGSPCYFLLPLLPPFSFFLRSLFFLSFLVSG